MSAREQLREFKRPPAELEQLEADAREEQRREDLLAALRQERVWAEAKYQHALRRHDGGEERERFEMPGNPYAKADAAETWLERAARESRHIEAIDNEIQRIVGAQSATPAVKRKKRLTPGRSRVKVSES